MGGHPSGCGGSILAKGAIMTGSIGAIDRVRWGERIPSLDVLRGFAILFILFMNMPWMGGYGFILFDPRYPSWTAADYWTTLTVEAFLSGTQRGLLELLFGAGIIIMARRAMEPDGPVEVADLHYRRNLWLIVFGLINGLVLMWYGDILLVYGIAACFLFPFRKASTKVLLGFAGLFLAGLLVNGIVNYQDERARVADTDRVVALQAEGKPLSADDRKILDEHAKDVAARAEGPAANAETQKRIKEADTARRTTFAAYWTAQWDDWIRLFKFFFWYIEAEILATMLIGMALYRAGIIQGKASSITYWAMLLVGYGAGLAIRGSEQIAHLRFDGAPLWQGAVGDLSRLLVTFGHLAAIQLLLRSGVGRALLKPLQAAGRMPLTVYLFTSLLMMWVIFPPWGFGMFGRWGMADMALVSAIVIAAEIVAANWWMKHFANGPCEWAWKSLAYQRREPFRRIAA